MRILLIICFFCVSHAIKAGNPKWPKPEKPVIHNNVEYIDPVDKTIGDKVLVCTGFVDTSKICDRLIIPDSLLVNGENWSVSMINVNAFKGIKDLQYVKLPNTLRTILSGAFEDCENLDSIYIPASVNRIVDYSFDNSNLISINVSPQNPYYDSRDNSHAIIDSKTNELLAGSASSTIPASVTKLREKAFSNRKRLKQITIPKNIRSIGRYCFHDCYNLSSITFEDNIDSESNNNGLTIKGRAFGDCQNITNISLPNRLDTIGPAVFAGCKKLESLYFPERVRYISGNQFNGCKNLKSIIVSPNNKVYDSRDNCNAIIETKTNKLIAGCKSTIIPNSIDTICCDAFPNMDIDSVYIPIGVKYIEEGAFFWSTIRSVVIPKSVKEIVFGSFDFCENLRSIYLGHTTPPIIKDVKRDEMKKILTTEEEKPETYTELSQLKDELSYLSNVCVYVPKIAYKKYIEHPVWKQLKIMPY